MKTCQVDVAQVSNRLARLSPRPHALRRKSPTPSLRRRHSPPLFNRTPLHAWRRQARNRRIVSRALSLTPTHPASHTPAHALLISHQPHARSALPLSFGNRAFLPGLLLLKFDDQRLEVRFRGAGRAVVHGRPAVCVAGERVGAVLQEHAEGFEFARGGSVVQRCVASVV